MATVVRMPKLGLTMTEGVITKWFIKEGENIEKGEPLLEIQTDKVNLEEEAPITGVLRKILHPEGSTVPITEPIAVLTKTADEPFNLETVLNPADTKTVAVYPEQKKTEKERLEKVDTDLPELRDKVKATPAARRLASLEKLDLFKITPTGKNGEVTVEDVEAYLNKNRTKTTPVARKIAESAGVDLSVIKKDDGRRIAKNDVLAAVGKPDIREGIELTGMRKIIADKMTKSKNTAPHYYVRMQVDMTKTIKLREELKLSGKKVSFNDIIIKVVSKALKEYPIINASVIDDKIVYNDDINIGLAVSLDDGLIVPVIKDCDKKTIGQISEESRALIKKAREGKLMLDDYSGGSFTVSNLGMFDVEEFTAIINQPESAILALGAITKTPVVEDEEIKIKPIMKMTLSSDHRIIDGAVAAAFLKRVKEILQNPVLLMA